MKQLTGLDTQFLAIESETTVGHVGGLAVFDPATAPGGKLGLAEVRAMLDERLHLLPPLRWTLVPVPIGLDRPYWKDDPDFDLDYHVRELALPAPGDDEQLSEQVARIASRRLDRARPLWELYVIHGLQDGRVAVLTKMHHAMIDGMSGAEIMGILFDLEPEGREIAPADGSLRRRGGPEHPRDARTGRRRRCRSIRCGRCGRFRTPCPTSTLLRRSSGYRAPSRSAATPHACAGGSSAATSTTARSSSARRCAPRA